jgi:hypothetical protein
MEYKRLWLKYNTINNYGVVNPTESEDTKKVDAEIAEHINEGWRIVSTAPITASKVGDYDNRPFVFTYTCGVEVFMIK